MKRPIIGISSMNERDSYGAPIVGMRPSYVRAIIAAGGAPLLIPLSNDLEAVRALYDLCQGILLPGGEDVDPAEYGEEPHPQLGEVDKQRDLVELTLARWCRADRKPLFGICRGIQVINVAFGGSLYQDIPSQYTTELDHRYNTHLRKYDILGHTINVQVDSWLGEHLGVPEVLSNTMHHQAIKDLAPGLRVVASAEDGIIEAVEGDGPGFVAAVQCHPEHLFAEAEPRWARTFRAFVELCQQRP
jgi:putative glutamine amidotransferase